MKLFSCPLCKLPLEYLGSGLKCQSGHNFDRAKEGYFNLLPVQYKQSKQPGDSAEQLNARRVFLQAGYFDPLLTALYDQIGNFTNLVDLGAGEGYFSNAMAREFSASSVYGVDISKNGMKLAAKKALKNSFFAVASSYDLPIFSNSVDVVTRIYAPSKLDEVARVLKENGLFVVVIPGQNHLINLRTVIYDSVRPLQDQLAVGNFETVNKISIGDWFTLEDERDAEALLLMTPFSWKLSPEKRQELIQSLATDRYDFTIHVLRKVCEK